MTNFELFWAAWPTSTRKGGKSDCLKRWEKYYCDSCADQIIKHIEWMKTTDQWRKDGGAYIPSPAVYLNQRRWDGAEIPEIKKTINIYNKNSSLDLKWHHNRHLHQTRLIKLHQI